MAPKGKTSTFAAGSKQLQSVANVVHPTVGRDPKWRTSLADFARVYGAHFVVVSLPEDAGSQERAPTLAVVEELPRVLKEEFGGRFSVAVDGRGSRAERWCQDVERRRVARKTEDVGRVELSYWFCFWKGRVTGAMTQALVGNISTSVSPKDLLQGQAVQLSTHDPRVRMVVVVSVDGGAAQEKQIPALCRDVRTDVQQKGYAWGPLAKIIWCHFPSVEDMLKSLSGLRRLDVDPGAESIGVDSQGSPLVYRLAPVGRKDLAVSLLRETAEEVMAKSQRIASDSSFLTACQESDVQTVAYILSRSPQVLGARDPFGATGLICAALEGSSEVVTELLQGRADPEATENTGATALAAAVCTGRVEAAGLLAVTQARRVPAPNVQAWANEGILAPLGAAPLEGREWGMLELAQQMAESLRTAEEPEWAAKFERISTLIARPASSGAALGSMQAVDSAASGQSYEALQVEVERLKRELREASGAPTRGAGTWGACLGF